MDKKTLRDLIIKQRGLISEADSRAKSEAIAKQLCETDFYQKARTVFCFISKAGEPNTEPIIRQVFADGKVLCVPRTYPDGLMEAVPVGEDAIASKEADWPSFFGIPEPPKELGTIDRGELDMIVVPSLAVDIDGYRLGFGGGYYDRFIESFRGLRTRPFTVAIQFAEFYYIKKLPRESHDSPVDAIITEEGIIIPSSRP